MDKKEKNNSEFKPVYLALGWSEALHYWNDIKKLITDSRLGVQSIHISSPSGPSGSFGGYVQAEIVPLSENHTSLLFGCKDVEEFRGRVDKWANDMEDKLDTVLLPVPFRIHDMPANEIYTKISVYCVLVIRED